VDIGQWLRGLGLQSYEQAFRNNGIDFDVLPRLTADDLKEIGVLAVGHRRKILDAIREVAARGSADHPGTEMPHHAERRQLTVMFCDLVGSTALSTRLVCNGDYEWLNNFNQLFAWSCATIVVQYMSWKNFCCKV
jgi:SAM domain (Sterile alpha motif)